MAPKSNAKSNAEEQARKRKAEQEAAAATVEKKLRNSEFDLTAALSKTTIQEDDESAESAGVSQDARMLPIVKIKDLNLTTTGRSINGKVTAKSFIRTFSGGKMFSFDVTDNTGTIRSTVFSKISTFDEVYKSVQINMNVNLRAFKVVEKKANYNTLPGDFELCYGAGTILTVAEDDACCPALTFDFIKLDKVNEKESGSQVDVIGIVSEISETEEVTNGPLRRVLLVDETGTKLQILLWKSAANDVQFDRGTTLAIKAGMLRKNTYQGLTTKTLGITANSAFWPQPDLPEAQELVTWMNEVLSNDVQ